MDADDEAESVWSGLLGSSSSPGTGSAEWDSKARPVTVTEGTAEKEEVKQTGEE